MTRVGIITQARTASTRRPRQILLEVDGKTLLDHHLDRLSASGHPVFVATTTSADDKEIASLAAGRGVGVHRGSEVDVLAVEDFVAAGDPWLYLSNTLERSFPPWLRLRVFSAQALAEAHEPATEAPQREHVTPYLYANTSGRMHLRNVAWPEGKSAYRVTLDTPDDLRLIRSLIEDHGAANLSCGEIIALLDVHPELVALNAHVEQKKLGE